MTFPGNRGVHLYLNANFTVTGEAVFTDSELDETLSIGNYRPVTANQRTRPVRARRHHPYGR